MLLNIKQASERLGYRSRSVLQRLVRDGKLDAYLRGTRGRAILLEWHPDGLPDLRKAVQGMVTVRVGSPLLSVQGEPARDWDAIAERANSLLAPELWGPPPWSADRWCGLIGAFYLVSEDSNL